MNWFHKWNRSLMTDLVGHIKKLKIYTFSFVYCFKETDHTVGKSSSHHHKHYPGGCHKETFCCPVLCRITLRAVDVVQTSSHVLSVSVCQQLPSLSPSISNFPFLSSETKSLSLSVTLEILKDIYHFKRECCGWLSVLLNFSLIHRDVMICVYRRVAAPCYWSRKGLLHLRKALHWPPPLCLLGAADTLCSAVTQQGSLLKPLPVCMCVCVCRHNNTIFLSPYRAPGRESGNEMEKLAQKDSPQSWNGGRNNEEFTGWYAANAESAGLEVGGVTLICSHTPA